jgi:hypothetical protein
VTGFGGFGPELPGGGWTQKKNSKTGRWDGKASPAERRATRRSLKRAKRAGKKKSGWVGPVLVLLGVLLLVGYCSAVLSVRS